MSTIRSATLRGLLRLASLVDERHLVADDVLQVFSPAMSLDARVDMLERVVMAARPESAGGQGVTAFPEVDRRDRRYWVNAMRVEPFTATDSTFVHA